MMSRYSRARTYVCVRDILRDTAYCVGWVFALGFILTGLYGCPAQETKPDVTDPITVGQEVKVVVREQCTVALPSDPQWQVDVTDTTDPLQRSEAILAELIQAKQYITKARAAIKKCE